MSVFGDPNAPVAQLEAYVDPPFPHVYTGGEPKRWCRIVVPGRVGSDRRRIVLDDGTELVVKLDEVMRTVACQACHFSGKVTRVLEPKEPAVVTRCERCHGLGRHPMPGQPARRAPAPAREPADVDERIEQPFANRSANRSSRAGRVDITGPGDWSRQRRDRGDWS